ncbi:MAG: tyrosine-type recombinase/integrase [Thiovulaceae bacterium]|nr:tyrosine-type recombinase/integrase [Sulfurimonadaceae bacterium]
MNSSATKPIKIKLSNNTASGMYILLTDDEIKKQTGSETKPPNRIYKIQIAVEAIYNNQRCRGKKSFSIPKGTSIVKAVASLQGKKDAMIQALKQNGTLKIAKVANVKKDPKDKRLDTLFDLWIANKSINSKPNTVRAYKMTYKTHISCVIGKKFVNTMTEEDVQAIINDTINKGKAANTIKSIKRVLKPLLEINDVLLNWTKITLPKDTSCRKYIKSNEDTFKIVNALRNYNHKVARGVFEFLLTGRRINETLYLTHENIDYKNNSFTIPAKYAKTKKDFVFALTPELIQAIKMQNTQNGRIFRLEHRQMLLHFKTAMSNIGIYDMVIHDLRSMVAQTALDNGANIYDVSKMLAHQKVATTEARYVEGGAKQAANAQKVFTNLVSQPSQQIDIINDVSAMGEYTSLKQIYPTATDEMIFRIMQMMSDNEKK